jgi:probable HAF family extracellular repeat protein
VGLADTSILDPNYPNSNPLVGADPFIQHGFRWRKGTLTDLGALPGINSSNVSWINDRGVPAGVSTTGNLDPVTGFPVANAVVWVGGHIFNLGTLDGGYESLATAINDQGQIAGIASNSTPDSNSLFGLGTQTRAFLWQDGAMRDLGTLGGSDAAALLMNNHGQIAGISYESSLAVAPFVWENGKMLNLGNFGGSFGGPGWLNNRGQVVGASNLSGDTTAHPFLWTEAEGMKDLGTLGGTFGFANWINESGEVVGAATNQGDEAVLAFLWKNGVMTNLGTLDGDPCSVAINVNSRRQVVGSSVTDCLSDSGRAFLWENSGPMIDLNTFLPPGSDLSLTQGAYINDGGEILATGVLPNGDSRAVLLVPCGERTAGCQDAAEGRTAATQNNPTAGINRSTTSTQRRLTPSEMMAALRTRLRKRYHFAGSGLPRD